MLYFIYASMDFDVTNTNMSKEGSIRREGMLALHFLPLIISTDDMRSGYTHTPSLNSPLVHTLVVIQGRQGSILGERGRWGVAEKEEGAIEKEAGRK